jgi:putative aminopeptidase FrvX
MLKHILKTLKEIQEIPAAPFLPKPMLSYIKGELDGAGVEFIENDYALIVPPKNPDATKPKLIIMAHIDHPGGIVKNKKEGIFMGTIGRDRIAKIIETAELPVRFFDKEGMLKGKGKIAKLGGKNGYGCEIETDAKILVNYAIQYDLPTYYKENTKTVSAYNSDNGAPVATALTLAKAAEKNFKNFNAHFVFTTHEEVHQISAWKLAKDNDLHIEKNDLIINLECLRVESIDTKKYGRVEYDGGVVLQLSNAGCLFGYKNKGPNQAETLVKNVTKGAGIPLQLGIIGDSCDSRPFSQFGLTPNICSLTIPNKNKHNWDYENDEVTLETIYKKDIENLYRILVGIKNFSSKNLSEKLENNVSYVLKNKGAITNPKLMRYKRILNERLHIANKSIIKRGYFYPESLVDKTQDFHYKLLSYIKYFYLKLFS